PNGAGKTTFFNMLTGVYKPTSGQVEFDGEDITGRPPHAITERGIGRTFQNIRLFQQMSALENVLVGMHARLRGGIFASVVRTPRIRREEEQARVTARELLAYCGLAGGGEVYARNLPYGDQRRLEVARALATQPKPLLLVEEIHTYYGTIEALKGISLEVREREIVTLIGSNGAGKTTTLRSINGLNHPQDGSIHFAGKNITHEPPHDIVRMGISQSPE